MKIRPKVFLIVVVVFGLLLFGTSRIFTKIETSNFDNLERQQANQNISRVQSALNGELDDLSVKLTDWSQWDDTYNFAENGNVNYIESNLPKETFSQLHLNFILIENAAGDVVFKQYIENNAEIPFPQDLQTLLADPKIASARQGTSLTNITGLVNTQEGPMVLAVQSITTSDGSAPARGLIVFGYEANSDFVATLSKTAVLKLDSQLFSSAPNQSPFAIAQKKLSSNNPTYIDEAPSANEISGFLLVPDIFGHPTLIIRADMPRDIHQVGLADAKKLNILLAGIGIFEMVVILILFEIFVLRKIYKLVQGVKQVSARNNKTERLEVRGSDEFASLDREINDMLDTLSTSRAEKQESESRFLNVADSAPVMIWASDETNRIIYVNKALTDFLGKSEDQLFGDGWIQVVHPEDKDLILEQYHSAAQKHETLTQKYRVTNAKGETEQIFVKAVARMTSQGVFKGYIGTAIETAQVEKVSSME